jgi:RimJ/RimL family protein N-acetyltransferase
VTKLLEISRAELEMLAHWFQPEIPGPVIAAHIIHTGCGRAWVDQWPEVQAVVVETNYNFLMLGNPSALDRDALRTHVAGFVAAPPTFVQMLETTYSDLVKWPRLIGFLPGPPAKPPSVQAELRRLRAEDAANLEMLSAESIWVAQTWGSGKELAQSGYGWGAWVSGVLASVACTFFLGDEYEDIGVVTEAPYRGQGLSTACVSELCQDVIARHRKPSWSTSTDNIGSWRVAEKVGFVQHRHDWLYVVGGNLPQ